MEYLIKAGGLYHFALVVFHLSFWRLFNWQDDLRSLTFLNRAVMQVLNVTITLIFIMFGSLSLLYTEDLLSTPLGKATLWGIAAVWLGRAVQQIVFFKMKHWGSIMFLLFFMLGAVLYGIPAFMS